MSESNTTTLQSYQNNLQAYVDGTTTTVDGHVKEWIDQAVIGLDDTARILEIGSAFGRDAAYLQSLGMKVECTDATQGFVELLQEKGFNARPFNAITDELDGPYDLVLANAVLLHFTRQETATVLAKISGALIDGGKFAFTLKQGEGEGWSEEKLQAPRYFCYWTEAQIREELDAAGYATVQITNGAGARNVPWLHIIAAKPA